MNKIFIKGLALFLALMCVTCIGSGAAKLTGSLSNPFCQPRSVSFTLTCSPTGELS